MMTTGRYRFSVFTSIPILLLSLTIHSRLLAQGPFTITASAGPNGTITPSGAVIVNQGSDTTFIVVPNSGFHVADLFVDGIHQDSTTSYTFINVTANHTISADFASDAGPSPTGLSVRDDFNRATGDLTASAPPFKWVKLASQESSSVTLQINPDSSISPSNPLGTTHFAGVAWDSLFTDTSQVALTVRQKSGNGVNSSFFIYVRMNSEDLSTGNGYRLKYFDNPTGTDQVIIQLITSGVNSVDLATLNREIAVGDTLVMKVEGDKTMKALVYGANGIRDSISVVDNTFNPSTWYCWLDGCVFDTPVEMDNFMIGKIPEPAGPPGTPAFSVNPASLAFDTASVGTTRFDTLTVTDTGTAPLIISSVAATTTQFNVTPSSGSLAASASREFIVSYSPTILGSQSASIIFYHNASGSPRSIGVTGTGIGSPSPVPLVTGIVPGSGPAGTGIAVNGANFSTSAGGNIVYFGATKATVTGASSNSLTASVPPGATYEPVTVTADSLTGYSPLPFTPTFSGIRGLDTTKFSARVILNSGENPHEIVPADIDGDGLPDIVVCNAVSSTMAVYRNTGGPGSLSATTFAAPVSYSTGAAYPTNEVIDLAVGDLDGDGKPDIVLIDFNGSFVSVFRNTSTPGAISFAPRMEISAALNPEGVAIADIDGDGKPDIVVANYGNTSFSVFPNTSSGGTLSFGPRVDFTTASGPASVSVGDLDGDGRPDVAVATLFGGLSLFRNTSSAGAISFATRVDLGTGGAGAICAKLGDFDGDGKLDILVVNQSQNEILVFRNSSAIGNLSFDQAAIFGVDAFPIIAAIGDLDGDGKPDIAVNNQNSNTVSIFRNTSSPGSLTSSSFALKFDLTTGAGPRAVSIGDLDGDERPDLLVTDELDSTLSLFRNLVAAPAFSVSPSSLSFGSLPVGRSKVDTLLVSNAGAAPLIVSSATSDNGQFLVIPAAETVAVGSHEQFLVTFHPTGQGGQTGHITFAYDAAGSPTTVVATGTGVSPTDTIVASAGPNGTISPNGTVVVGYGDSARFTFTPAAGYHLDSLFVDGTPVAPAPFYTFHNVTSNHSISARFAINHYTITATAGANGAVSPPGTTTVSYGDSLLIAMTPNTGYHVDSVFVDSVFVGAPSSYVFRSIASNHTLRAAFAINRYTISASAGGNGTIAPSGSVVVNYGDSATFTMTPATGYHIDSVFGDSVFAGSPSSYKFTDVTSNHSISVRFAINHYTITATAGPNGTIAPLGAVVVNYGDSATFTMTPATGYHIDSVFVDSVFAGSPSNYKFSSVTSNHSIGVKFAINRYTITSTAGPNGVIAPSGTIMVNYGDSASFTMTPNTGYHVDSVFVDGNSVGARSAYPFAAVSANHTISVEFAINRFFVSASAGPNGTIAPTGSIEVNYGDSVTFTMTPATGYHVDSVFVDSVFAGSPSIYKFSNVTSNHSIGVKFAINHYTITATAGANGAVSPPGSTTVSYGDTLLIAMTPNTGYHVDSVFVDSVFVGAPSSYVFRSIASNHTLRAAFAINRYTISASAGANGTIAPSGSVAVSYGDSASFTMTPNTGYHVDSVFVDSVFAGSPASYKFTDVTSNHSISVRFTINHYAITATAAPNGTIAPSGAVVVNYGDSATFTMTPAAGYHIDSVFVDSVFAGSPSIYKFWNVTSNHTIGVRFAINHYTITATAGPNGTISPPGTQTLAYGDSISFSMSPNTGYHIDSVFVDSVYAGAIATYKFTGIASNHTINVRFAINRYTISASAGLNGTITPSGPIEANYGDSVGFTMTPHTGYHIDSVFVDGTSVGPVASYKFSDVTANHSIAVKFAINRYAVTTIAGANGTITPGATVQASYGDTVTFAITGNTGYHIDSVFVDGAYIGAPSGYSFQAISANHTLRASFAINRYTLTASSGPHGTITPAGSTIVSYGDSVLYVIMPVTGYHIDSVIVDGIYAGSGVVYQFNFVTSNHTIVAKFAVNKFFVFASAGPGGSISPTGTDTVSYGDSVLFTITPSFGHHIDSVFVDSAYVGALSSYRFVNVVSNQTISVRFARNTYTITSAAGANGSVIPSGTISVSFGDTATFTFNPASGYHVDSIIVDGVFAGNSSAYSFNSVSAHHTLTVSFALDDLIVAVADSWNLLSVPRSVANRDPKAVFPTSLANAFSYQDGYVVADTLEPGKGYWLKFSGNQSVAVSGPLILLDSVAVAGGWNMVGSIAHPLPAQSIQQAPSGIVHSMYFGYDHGYYLADTIAPGYGYWVKTTQAGMLVLNGQSLGPLSRAGVAQSEAAVEGMNLLTISRTGVSPEGRGSRRQLHFAIGPVAGVTEDWYHLPPAPPGGGFDARFSGDRLLALLNQAHSGSEEVPIMFQPQGASFEVEWTVQQSPTVRWSIVEKSGRTVVALHRLSGSGSMIVDGSKTVSLRLDEIPAVYALRQNYPNPFNPSTAIEFDLPRASKVDLTVYDVVGREVAKILDGQVVEEGTHRQEFHAEGLASGVYMYRLVARAIDGSGGTYSDVKKMILMR